METNVGSERRDLRKWVVVSLVLAALGLGGLLTIDRMASPSDPVSCPERQTGDVARQSPAPPPVRAIPDAREPRVEGPGATGLSESGGEEANDIFAADTWPPVGNLGQAETAELRRDLAEVNAQVRNARSKEEQAGHIKAFTQRYPLTSYAHGYMNYLARLYADMGRQEEAEALFQHARSLARGMGTDKELEALISVTAAYLDMTGGRYDRAESALRRLIPAPSEALRAGAADRDKFQQRALWAPVYLARVLEKKGQLPQARATMEEAVRRLTDLYNNDPRADWVFPHLSQAAYWHLDLLLRSTPGPDAVPKGKAFVEQFRRSLPDTAALAACCRRLQGAIEAFEEREQQTNHQALP